MDVSYLFWCSPENQKCETSEVKELKEIIEGMKEKVAVLGLQLGTMDVGEAATVMHKGKDPFVETLTENHRRILSKSRNKRSHSIGSEGIFDKEFERVVIGM